MEIQHACSETSPVRHIIIASCILLVCTLINPAFANQEDNNQEGNKYDESLNEQFLKEAPGRWVEYADKTKRLQGHISVNRVQSNGYISKSSLTLKKGTGDRLSLTTTSEIMPSEDKAKETTFDAQGFNPKYAFALKRNDASRSWLLTALTERYEDPPSFLSRLNRGVDFIVNRILYIESERLDSIIEQAEFRVIGCRRIRASGEDLVLVDFDYPHEDVKRNEVQNGSLILDPRRYWCLRSYNARVKVLTGGKGTVKFTLVKWRDTDGILVPIAAMLEADAIEDNIRYKNKREYNYDLSIPDNPPPDSEFILSAYGLPEPNFFSDRGIPLYVWAGVIGTCCLSIGILLRWWMRRAEKGS